MPLVRCPEPGCVRFIETENSHSITEWLGLHTCSAIPLCPSCEQPFSPNDEGVVSDSPYYLGQLVCTPCTIDWDELYNRREHD